MVDALTFLTRIPFRRRKRPGPDALARGAIYFPVVGAAMGALVGATAIGLEAALPATLAATIAVAVELIFTGALHADGLADCADGLGGRDREHALRIMRDHSIGTYGACALALTVVARITALAALAASEDLTPVIAAYSLSRAAPVTLAAVLPYARQGAGAGRLLTDHLGAWQGLAAGALACGIAVGLAGLWGSALVVAAGLTVAAVGLIARRRLGGVTGDVMGAGTELSATAALIVAVVALP